MKNPLPAAAWLILAARAPPADRLRRGHARLRARPRRARLRPRRDFIARGDGYPYTGPRAARPRSARPPTPTCSPASTRSPASRTRRRRDRVVVARAHPRASSISTLIVALIGVVAAQLWGRRVALLAMAGARGLHPADPRRRRGDVRAAVRAAAARRARRRAPAPALDPPLALGARSPACSRGLTILTRANALVLLLPLALAVWTVRPRFSPRALAAPAVLVVLALLTVSPWTIRNAIVFDRFIPVSTQLGSALAGTYNDQARAGQGEPGLVALDPARPGVPGALRAPARDPRARGRGRSCGERSKAYIREHPTYVGEVALWTTLRMFELGGLDWSRHTAVDDQRRRRAGPTPA